MSERTAKIIRVLTLPPVLLLPALLLLHRQYPDGHIWAAILLLCGLPALSYLIWRTIPQFYHGGRPLQRKLAALFSVCGYVLGLLYCLITRGSDTELYIYLCYLISGGMIALSPYCMHIKISGHAAGVVGPVMALTFRLSPWFLLGLLIMIPVWKSSVVLGRHTTRELLLGGCYAVFVGVLLGVLIL
ncbi:MAG: hypothetical protein IKE43_01485 [Coriobacteriales bacterium]|nr:hypothetical protein [Coriobacteriales bacterium]